jgi:hypothetical protein
LVWPASTAHLKDFIEKPNIPWRVLGFDQLSNLRRSAGATGNRWAAVLKSGQLSVPRAA